MRRILVFAGVVAFVGLIAAMHYSTGQSQTLKLPKSDPPAKPAVQKPSVINKYITLLNQEMDVTAFQKAPIFKIKDIVAKLSSGAKGDSGFLPILIDEQDFKIENPDAPSVAEVEVQFPPNVKKMSRAMVLRVALSQVPTDNATFLVRRDGVRITTLNSASLAALLREKVVAVYEKRPLQDVLTELSQHVGVTVLIDPRAKEKISSPITASFSNDISLKSALNHLADMADLKCIINDDSVYVTTAERAKAMQKELDERRKQQLKSWKELGGAFPGGAGLVGNPGGFQIQGGGFNPGGIGGFNIQGGGIGFQPGGLVGGFQIGGITGMQGSFSGQSQFDPGSWHRQQPANDLPGLGI